MQYISLTLTGLSDDKIDECIALLDDELHLGMQQEEHTLSIFYLEEHKEQALANIKKLNLEVYIQEIPLENWNQSWEKNFEPIRIQNKIALRADFHEPIPEVDYELIITPKMSFGTGHHATTQQMLSMMLDIDFENKSVFDFGCGTGVLAIFAEKKGASYIEGIDNEAWSVENAKDNALRNACQKVVFSSKDISEVENEFDIILANINLNILTFYLKQIYNLLAPQGILLLSGILESDIKSFEIKLLEENLQIHKKTVEKEWACLYINKI
ncbi:MAG: 50S ribosomal protein L11 methyltransferase [Chitinophagaceae bacterium]